MSLLTVLYAALFYAATALLVVGLARKIIDYARTPAPLLIPTTPAPTTTSGMVFRQELWRPCLRGASLAHIAGERIVRTGELLSD